MTYDDSSGARPGWEHARAVPAGQLGAVLSLIPDPAVVVDASGRIVSANDQADRLFGYTPGSLIGVSVDSLIPGGVRARHRQHRRDFMAEPQTRPMGAGLQLSGRRLGGSEVPVDISLAPIMAEGQRLVVAAIRDVSSQREAAAVQVELAATIRGFADEQAALRRVATLVARAAAPEEIFAAVTEEVEGLFHADLVSMDRYDRDGRVTVLAARPALETTEWRIGGHNISTYVYEMGLPARIDDYTEASGPGAAPSLDWGVRCAVGAPITVEGRLWGLMFVGSRREHGLPPDTEERLAGFAELIATAVANVEARAELRVPADDQAALRHVATVVTKAAPREEVYAIVAEEIAGRLGAEVAAVLAYEGGNAVRIMGGWGVSGMQIPIGAVLAVGGNGVAISVLRSGAPAYVEHLEGPPDSVAGWLLSLGIRSGIGSPIHVEDRLWGVAIAASTHPAALPAGTEERIAKFIELISAVIANAEGREELHRIAAEQAALRRVATLVAEAGAPAAVFAMVAEEVGRVLGVDGASVCRYDDDDSLTVVAAWSAEGVSVPAGSRHPVNDGSVAALVRDTGRPARVPRYPEELVEIALEVGVRSAAGAPIILEGRTWGFVSVSSFGEEPLAPGTEARLDDFTGLVATAVANAQARAELTASRARIVASGDEARRQIVRDLHDGAQRHVVNTILALKLAEAAFKNGDDTLGGLLGEVLEHANETNVALRELSRGILPSDLTEDGLSAAIEALVSRARLPIEIDMTPERFPPEIEANAYFVVAEALNNVAKHSRAQRAEVIARADDGMLRVEVRDDGVGGARLDGSGLSGMKDRVTALGGQLQVESPPGGGTHIVATLPATEPPQSPHDPRSSEILGI